VALDLEGRRRQMIRRGRGSSAATGATSAGGGASSRKCMPCPWWGNGSPCAISSGEIWTITKMKDMMYPNGS
jgi:hypothetical protein